ncbi:hypothetical protein H113_08937 [Trichophyton rubrum MR1459]|uniref:Uncharacterized protein n=1 Tax=Trichophyton rubrum (strain ATCC MYA-4607 / CBS 118892) TaxID=559305 RepID=A0A080WIZ0_TRIRC|nr:uncharacterized protein TERG_11713 [Trichophyton rubrum CBS 118892]EZF89852.1 hypothetical protein H113_08937 [Trichophyton rubrum MR1459]EZG00937.1 hypothetical protein H106_08744 [Trichophyton rubrum CBS 735.88]KFL60592.1 hypothetical protein TERG_11713 [Trichophyton rubrum CBS 118892]
MGFVSCPLVCHSSWRAPCPTQLPHAGRPHPMPTNKYIKNKTTTINKTITLVFFHHIRRRRSRLRTLKSRALLPSLSVLSIKVSIRSPLSRTRSIFSVMISRTLSISLLAEASESDGGVVLKVCSKPRKSLLKAAHP